MRRFSPMIPAAVWLVGIILSLASIAQEPQPAPTDTFTAKAVSAFSTTTAVEQLETSSGPLWLTDGKIESRLVGLIRLDTDKEFVFAWAYKLPEMQKVPLISSPTKGTFLIDQGPGRYLVNMIAFQPGQWQGDHILEIPAVGPTPPDPKPDEPDNPPGPNPPAPDVPADAFDNIGQRVLPLALKMPAPERKKWREAFLRAAEKMERQEVLTIRQARADIDRLTAADPAVQKGLFELLTADGNARMGSLTWSTTQAYYRAIAAGFKE